MTLQMKDTLEDWCFWLPVSSEATVSTGWAVLAERQASVGAAPCGAVSPPEVPA